MVVFGGNDYSMSIGNPVGRSLVLGGHAQDPEVEKVRREVFAADLSMGVQPRAEIRKPEEAKPYLDMGVRHFGLGSDLIVLYRWVQDNVGELREMIEGG